MERILSNKIELVLLHDSNEAMEPQALLKLINEFGAGYDLHFEPTRFQKAPDYLHFFSGGSTIEVDYVDEPVVPEAFTSALASGHVIKNFAEAASLVEQHQKYVHICIWNGRHELPDPITGEEPPFPANFKSDDFDAAVAMLRFIAAVQINQCRPLAVYWVQSDRLMRIPEFLQLAIDFKDQTLLVNPLVQTEEMSEDGMPLNGMKTFGARNLIGKELLLSPSPMPMDELYQCALHFVAITRGTGLLIPDGDVFGRSEGEIIRVKYGDDPETGEPIAQLNVEYSREHSIGEPPVETEENETVYEVDLDDPAEKAMHDRIEAMKQEAEGSSSASDEEVVEFQTELGQEPEWTGVQRKVDMSSLRSLTSATIKSEEDAEEKPASSSNIMGKVSGLFQRKRNS